MIWQKNPYHTPVILAGLLLSLSVAGCTAQQTAQTTPTSPSPIAELPTLPTPGLTPSPLPTATPLVLTAPDKTSQITLPGTWTAQTNLNPEAQIQAANWTQGLYLIVLSEAKDKLKGMTRDKHSQITRELLTKNLVQPQVSKPTTVTQVNGNPAIQYEIRGSLNNFSVQFLHTTIETPTQFVQILAWAPPEAYERNKAELQAILQTYRPSVAQNVSQ